MNACYCKGLRIIQGVEVDHREQRAIGWVGVADGCASQALEVRDGIAERTRVEMNAHGCDLLNPLLELFRAGLQFLGCEGAGSAKEHDVMMHGVLLCL